LQSHELLSGTLPTTMQLPWSLADLWCSFARFCGLIKSRTVFEKWCVLSV